MNRSVDSSWPIMDDKFRDLVKMLIVQEKRRNSTVGDEYKIQNDTKAEGEDVARRPHLKEVDLC